MWYFGSQINSFALAFVKCTAFLFSWSLPNHKGWYSCQACLTCVHLTPKSTFCTRNAGDLNLCHLWPIGNNCLEHRFENCEATSLSIRKPGEITYWGLPWTSVGGEAGQSTCLGSVTPVLCTWGRHRKHPCCSAISQQYIVHFFVLLSLCNHIQLNFK